MPSITATEAQLRADDRPVLFLDTCILLDIFRVRSDIYARNIYAVRTRPHRHLQQGILNLPRSGEEESRKSWKALSFYALYND